MHYWLIKSEPETYSWNDLVKLGRDKWDGVRNYAARNNLRSMKLEDFALFYHSVNEKSIVGIAEVVKEHYPDPTTDDDRWSVVDFAPKRTLNRPITLNEIKLCPQLSEMVLVHNSRLSVQPVSEEEFNFIIELSESIKP